MPTDATNQEIKKAYHRLAKRHHPDKGGDNASFQELNEAHETLTDSNKRQKYDQEQKQNDKKTAPNFGSRSEPWDSPGFSFGTRGRGWNKPKIPEIVVSVEVSLSEFFTGATKWVTYKRKGYYGETKMCPYCFGKGYRQTCERNQWDRPRRIFCDTCLGLGRVTPAQEKDVGLHIKVEPGMPSGHRFLFENVGHQDPEGLTRGNVVFYLAEKKHEIFTRQGDDLFLKRQLCLKESLTGFSFTIQQLDGRLLKIYSMPGEVIPPSTPNGEPVRRWMQGRGMPKYGNPSVKGNLYLDLSVRFPKTGELSSEVLAALKQVLPGP